MKKKKLIFILPEYDPDTSTHFRYTLELADAIAEHMNVVLFIERANGIPQTKHIKKVYAQKFRNILLSQLERLIMMLWFRLRGYNRVYVHYAYLTGLIAIWVMRLTGGKSWYWHCEQRAMFETKWNWTLAALKKKLFVDWPFRFLLKSVNTLITCTERMKPYYVEHFNVPAKKIEIVYNWIDVEAIKTRASKPDHDLQKILNIRENKKIILYVHWLSPRKGSRALPNIFNSVLSQRKDVHFVIVGGGPDENRLREFVKDNQYEHYVTLTSEVPNHDIPRYFSISDVFIVPSQNEEFGRVNIEAMAMGVPLVATQTLATEAIFTPFQKKYTSQPEDYELFSHHIQTIIDDTPLHDKLVKEGFKQVEKYDKLPNVNKFLTLFNA
jgi:glycosyltransferase involved in cell wall biosynthesis